MLITYANGRRSSIQVGPNIGGAWTATFPRVESWTQPPNQLPVSAINYVCKRTPEGIHVFVSVFRGMPHQQEDPVADVLMTPDRTVVIDQLKTVGVEPVTLALGNVATTDLAAPQVSVASRLVEVVEVKVSTSPPQAYLVVLRNRGAKPVRGIFIETTRRDALATSGRRVGREGTALIEVGTDFTLDVRVPAGRPGPGGAIALNPVDHIHITSVIWGDGTYEGDVAGINSLISDYGNGLAFAQILAELRRPGITPTGLRTALTGVSIDVTEAMVDEAHRHVPASVGINRSRVMPMLRSSIQSIKTMALAELAEFESAPPAAGNFAAWLSTTTERYSRWLARLKQLSGR